MSKYIEDGDDSRARIFLEYGRRIVDSFNKGDFLTVADFCDDSDDDLSIMEEFLDLDYILSKKRFQAISLVNYEDKENELDLKIIRLYQVTEKGEDGIPIIQRVKFPGEHGYNNTKYSLLALFFNYIESHCNCSYSTPSIKFISEFAKLDGDYADSIILESTYAPYERSVKQIHDIEIELDIVAKKWQKERVARARREKRGADRMWKGEFERVVGNGLRKKYKG